MRSRNGVIAVAIDCPVNDFALVVSFFVLGIQNDLFTSILIG